MRKRLKLEHTNQYYISRLKDLSVNNDIYDVVVEHRENSFMLYQNFGPLMRWEKMTNSSGRMNSYKAILTFEGQDILMEVKMRGYAFWSYSLWNLAIGGFSIYNMYKGDPAWLFSGLLLLIGIIFYQWERRLFKKFIPNFLNNLQ